MTELHQQITYKLYALIQDLPRQGCDTSRNILPLDGIYLFFEVGETARYGDVSVDRIVRVGINTADQNFPSRVMKHYTCARGNSSFRRHVGAALLNRDGASEDQIRAWRSSPYPPMPDLEQRVSALLCRNFSFSCFGVSEKIKRETLETALIAQFAQYPLDEPSSAWLGRHSVNPRIRRYGLWNSDDVDKAPVTTEQLNEIRNLIDHG